MAGSSTTWTYDDGNDGKGQHSNVCKAKLVWVSDDTTGAVTGTSRKIVGRLIKAVTVPSGTAAPTDNYDVTITDEQSVNVLAGCDDDLADRDTANTEEVYFLLKDHAGSPLAQSLHPVLCNVLSVAITNAGNSKGGTLILYYQPL